jgi:hypothetical protein
MRATDLTYDVVYRIKGVPDNADDDAHWHYIGTLAGAARFSNGEGTAIDLMLDRLIEIERCHLAYAPALTKGV